MRNDAIKIWFQTGRSLHWSKAWTNLCSAELKSLLHSFSFELQFLPQHQTPGQQLHKEGYLTGKGVTPTSHLSSCWDYQTHRGFWSVRYLPWIISPSSLFWQYKRKASSSSIWDEMVQGSPNKKKATHRQIYHWRIRWRISVSKKCTSFKYCLSFSHLTLSWHFDQSQNGTTQLFLLILSKLSRQNYPIG